MSKPEPVFKELLASDLAYNWLALTPDISVAQYDPSAVWELIRWNPWLAMGVYADIEEKDAVVASSLDTRKDGVLSRARRVMPASDRPSDRRIADKIEETLESYCDDSETPSEYAGLDAMLYEMLDAIGKGVSIAEILWGQGSDRIYLRGLRFKPQHLFAFNEFSTPSYATPQTGPLRLRTGIPVEGVSNGILPENKFLVASYRPRLSNRWGTPLLRKVFWPSWFKRASVKQWLRYLEKGTGSVVTRYHDGAGEAEQNKALDAARAVNEESAVALPQKFALEVLEHVRQNIGTAFPDMVDGFCNNEIMRVVLGQTLTSRGSEGGGSRALGEVHQTVRYEKIEADAKFLMYVVNRYLVWPLVLFNYGWVKPPLWVINYDPERDLTAISTYLGRLWNMHVAIPRNYIYETFQIPAPGPDSPEEVFEKATADADVSVPDTGADFAEKKTPEDDDSMSRSQSRMGRLGRLRPSTMASWKE